MAGQYAATMNGSLVENEAALAMLKEDFAGYYNLYSETNIAFHELSCAIMRKAKCTNAIKFQDRTHMSVTMYYRFRNGGSGRKPGFLSIINFGVSMGVDKAMMDGLLQKAGLAFDDSAEHRVYAYLFTHARLIGCVIDEANAFLKYMGVPLLGDDE
jgi:hypothetical protein